MAVFFIFAYGLFNDTISNLDYFSSDCEMVSIFWTERL